ncbi:MAG: ComF family protein [Solirubrobacteraceae bacterium]
MRRAVSELRALVVPPVCVACRVALRAAEEILCPSCRRRLPWLGGPLCVRCGLPPPCRPCAARHTAFDASWAPLAHEGVARTIVRALKYDARLCVADAMASQLAAGAPSGMLAVGAALVPVPADPGRRRARGYAHVELLTAALARRARLPVARCLRQAGGTPAQVGRGRAERLARQPGIQAVGRAPSVAVLVDDVHTTGATLDACARALRDAGAERVAAVTYTRALRR